jgi:hypothetical protein
MEESQQLAAAATSNDPATGLRGVAALRKLLDHLENVHVDNARARGWSWQEIAAALGVSRQAVHKKHGRR